MYKIANFKSINKEKSICEHVKLQAFSVNTYYFFQLVFNNLDNIYVKFKIPEDILAWFLSRNLFNF